MLLKPPTHQHRQNQGNGGGFLEVQATPAVFNNQRGLCGDGSDKTSISVNSWITHCVYDCKLKINSQFIASLISGTC